MHHPPMEPVILLRRDRSVLRQIVHEVNFRLDRLAQVCRLRCGVILLRVLVEGEVGGVVRGQIVVPDALLVTRGSFAGAGGGDEGVAGPLVGEGILDRKSVV